MRAIPIALLLSVSNVAAGPLPKEISSGEGIFHRMLHEESKIYLVCLFAVHKKRWMKRFEQLVIKATIVDVIKGEKLIGDKISFRVIMDGKFGDISHLPGSLFFADLHNPSWDKYYEDDADARLEIAEIYDFSPSKKKVADEHKQAEQGAAANP